MAESEKIEIENITSPGRVTRVDKAKYLAMETAYLSVLRRRRRVLRLRKPSNGCCLSCRRISFRAATRQAGG